MYRLPLIIVRGNTTRGIEQTVSTELFNASRRETTSLSLKWTLRFNQKDTRLDALNRFGQNRGLPEELENQARVPVGLS